MQSSLFGDCLVLASGDRSATMCFITTRSQKSQPSAEGTLKASNGWQVKKTHPQVVDLFSASPTPALNRPRVRLSSATGH